MGQWTNHLETNFWKYYVASPSIVIKLNKTWPYIKNKWEFPAVSEFVIAKHAKYGKGKVPFSYLTIYKTAN